MTPHQKNDWREEFDAKFSAWETDDEGIKAFIETLLTQQAERIAEEEEKAIDENIRLNQSTHRIGSHSDDFGGENDYPCYCDEKERAHKIEALESLKKKLRTRNT